MNRHISTGDTVEITAPGDHYGKKARVVSRANETCFLECGGLSLAAHESDLKRLGGGYSYEELDRHPKFRSLSDEFGHAMFTALYKLVTCNSLDNRDYAVWVLKRMGVDPAHLTGEQS